MRTLWTIVAVGVLGMALGCGAPASAPRAPRAEAAPKERTVLLVTLAGLT